MPKYIYIYHPLQQISRFKLDPLSEFFSTHFIILNFSDLWVPLFSTKVNIMNQGRHNTELWFGAWKKVINLNICLSQFWRSGNFCRIVAWQGYFLALDRLVERLIGWNSAMCWVSMIGDRLETNPSTVQHLSHYITVLVLKVKLCF